MHYEPKKHYFRLEASDGDWVEVASINLSQARTDAYNFEINVRDETPDDAVKWLDPSTTVAQLPDPPPPEIIPWGGFERTSNPKC
ncbi:MAG: hypothetical protein ACREGC_03795 [Minisyncoccia bacterium]